MEPGPGVDDPLATDDLLRVLLLELILLTVMAHIAPHLRLPVEMNLPGALHVHQFLPLCHLMKTLPKALQTQVLTALTSNFGLVALVQ